MPYTLTAEEAECVATIRRRVPDIPKDLDTDLNLRRWQKGWKGNVEAIVPRLSAYIANRKAAGYDGADFIRQLPDLPVVKKYLKFYSISRFLEPVVVRKSNTILFIQRTEGIFHDDVIRTILTSDILLLYFAFCELTLRHILALEAETGEPSAMTVILDLHNLPLNEWAVPTSPANVLMRLCMSIFQDWYCEFLHKSLVVNPPTIVNVLWQIGKAFISENTLSKIIIVSKLPDLKHHMEEEAIPVAYGGKFVDAGGHGEPEYGTNKPTPITPDDHYKVRSVSDVPLKVGSVWRSLGLEADPAKEKDWVKPGKTLRLERSLSPGQTIAWQFLINGEMVFRVLRLDGGGEETVFPELNLATLHLAEEGSHRSEAGGLYAVEWKNTSSYLFAIRLDYALLVK